MIGKLKAAYLRQRFFPNWISLFINPFFLIRRALLNELRALAPNLGGRVLDFGCGAKPYRELFLHATEYIGVDMENEGHDHSTEEIDVYYDGATLPFDDNSFDGVFTSEVLEHVPDINDSLQELNRVLKPNGRILITVPFVFPEHEMPNDFRRLNANGLHIVLQANGFRAITIRKGGSFLEVIFQLTIMYIHSLLFTQKGAINLLINCLLIAPLSLVGMGLSWLLPHSRGLYFSTLILAEKVRND